MPRTHIIFDNYMSKADVLFKTMGLVMNIKVTQIPWSLVWRLYYYLSIFNLCLVIASECTFIIMSLLQKEHFLTVTLNFCCIGFAGLALIKLFVIMQNNKKLVDLLQELREIFPKEPKQQLSYKAPYYLHIYNKIGLGYMIIHLMLIWSFNLAEMFVYLVKRYLLHLQDVQANLPYACYIPWNWQGNWTYYLIYFIFSIAGQTCMSGQLANDLMFFANCNQLLMHYRHLSQSVLQFVPTEKVYQNHIFLRKFISRHQKLLR